MALVLKDRVQETTNAPGTGTATLLGAVTGYQTFSSAIGNTNTTYYTIADQVGGANWEVGIGTVGAGTLARTTVLASSNGGSLTNFSSGTQNVFCTYTATQAVYYDGNGNVGIGVAPSNLDFLEIAQGTTAKAPIGLNSSGANLLTTPDPGSIEYNGVNLFFTTTGTARNAVLTPYVYRKAGTSTIANATGNQSIFVGTLSTGVALAATTTYEFEVVFKFSSTGATSHTEAVGFTYSGTTTDVNFLISRLNDSPTATATQTATWATAITPTVMTGAITSTQNVIYTMRGTLTTNTAGNLLPVIALSAAPGATSTIQAGAYMKILPYTQSSATVTIGTWA